MTPRLSKALNDLADEAGSYASLDAVLAETGRRRTVISAAAAVLANALGGGVIAARPKPMPHLAAAWPAPDAAQTLPTTRQVGHAAYAYTTDGSSYLVTDDGRDILPSAGLPGRRYTGHGRTRPDALLRNDFRPLSAAQDRSAISRSLTTVKSQTHVALQRLRALAPDLLADFRAEVTP